MGGGRGRIETKHKKTDKPTKRIIMPDLLLFDFFSVDCTQTLLETQAQSNAPKSQEKKGKSEAKKNLKQI